MIRCDGGHEGWLDDDEDNEEEERGRSPVSQKKEEETRHEFLAAVAGVESADDVEK